MKRKYIAKVYFNKTLYITGMTVCMIIIVGIVGLFLYGTDFKGFNILSWTWNHVIFFFLLILPSVALPFLGLLGGWNARMLFCKEGVEFRQAFRKREFHPWKEYYHVTSAGYLYCGFPVWYIVLSNRRLRNYETCQINDVPISPLLLKIRYNKKNYETLLAILPRNLANSLRVEFKDIPARRFNFLI